jgi:uncharacterized protein with ParB-like and HNH nuclease domain
MKINIESTPRSIGDLFFNDGTTMGSGTFSCIGKSQRVNKIIVPLYQRQYDWEKEELLRLLINTNEYILSQLPNTYENSYFVGTVLLEKQSKNDGHFELIDGQQRLTTAFLLNFVGYISAIERLSQMSTFTPRRYAAELTNRLKKIKSYENKLFSNKKNVNVPQDWDYIFTTEFLDEDDVESTSRIKFRLSIDNILQFREPKINHENPDQHDLFIDTLRKTKITCSNNQLSVTILKENEFNERTNNIFDYFNDYHANTASNDSLLEKIINDIDKFSAAISFCVLVSDNPDDSFKLFEVLNSTGRLLTIIDKLKNHLYERVVKKEKTLNNDQFNTKWNEILEAQSNSGSSNITIDLVRSESALIKEKFYEYFSNKKIHLPNKTILRDEIFREENSLAFLNRISTVAKTLERIYSIDAYSKHNAPHTLSWYYRMMNKINYDWGRQILLGTITLTNHLASTFPVDANGCWDTPSIDNHTTLRNLETTQRFIVNLSDILLKIGSIGIINGLSSKKLPAVSHSILQKILDFVRYKKDVNQLKDLFLEINAILKLYILEEKTAFENNIRSLTYTKSTEKKYMTNLLYILYNKGNGASYTFEKPSLEHFEPKTLQNGNNSYYSGSDREEMINKLGNMILMNQRHNSILSNLPINLKLQKIQNDFTNDTFFGTNLFRNLIPNSAIHGDIPPYKGFPIIDHSLAYGPNGEPHKDLFRLRLDFYVKNLITMICSDDQFILTGEEYLV